MKQSVFQKNLTKALSYLKIGKCYQIKDFHIDIILSLYKSVKSPIFFCISDCYFDNTITSFSNQVENDSVIFIPPHLNITPSGFYSYSHHQLQRSKKLLSNGYDSLSFIICSESELSRPIVGLNSDSTPDFNLTDGFSKCIDFLETNDYNNTDVVLSPGNYSVRGGIVDIFPFTSYAPVRISFLDKIPTAHRFNVETQLTTDKIGKFSIHNNNNNNKLCSFNDLSLNSFISLVYSLNNENSLKIDSSISFSDLFSIISYKEFLKNKDSIYKNIYISNDLSSIGVVFNQNCIFVPPWFVDSQVNIPIISNPVKKSSFNISNIKKGDYLVHRDHGVGLCLGLSTKKISAINTQEFLSIKYKDGGIIRLDISHIDLIDFFASSDTKNISMDSLQKKSVWNRKRVSAEKQASETIDHLLNLYVKRNVSKRIPYTIHNDIERKFISDFPYEETGDQLLAWEDISKDLSGSTPMDRLLCGDVGFGKTEIAIRTAFRCVLGEKRVLVLAPTTILANQLFLSFSNRMDNHAINIDMISRFRTQKDIKEVQNKILNNNNDILIGTHLLLNNNIYLKNLGLLIIDEEHRFGVKQKENIKGLKENIDVLSMSATPIPRSINLALSGLYSISLLQTPPLMRIPITTNIKYYSDKIIKESVLYEIGRGGQVFFVHNEVQSIKLICDRLKSLLPNLRITYIHGKEKAKDVEQKMSGFLAKNIDILVCTSIIEAGIDISNANCLIINNAHLFGLSQLYQIRGRVGRGNRQAYAYMLIPKNTTLSKNAFRRIKTIEENTRLGSGYTISRSDMEIRGSGTLFGYKQSGVSSSIGYEMYLRLLQRNLHENGQLVSNFTLLPEDVIIEIYNSRFIPLDYIGLENLRLSFYINFSSAKNDSEIDGLKYSLINRFGPLPIPVEKLIKEYRLRLKAAYVGIKSIIQKNCGIIIEIPKESICDATFHTINKVQKIFNKQNIVYHLIPNNDDSLNICVHIDNSVDKYLLFRNFINKFNDLSPMKK